MLRNFIKFFVAILFFCKSLIILMMSLIHKIIFRISIGSRWCSVYLIAQKGERNRVNILQLNWKTRGCHEQRPYVHRPRGNLCNYPFACSLLLFPSWTVPSHPIFARGINSSEIEICTGLNRNSRNRTFPGVKFTAKASTRFSERRSSSDRGQMTRTRANEVDWLALWLIIRWAFNFETC